MKQSTAGDPQLINPDIVVNKLNKLISSRDPKSPNQVLQRRSREALFNLSQADRRELSAGPPYVWRV